MSCFNSFLTVFPQIFGGNMDIKTERRHYLNVPMVTRYIRLHPLTWRKRIGLRAGAIGCHHTGEDCGPGFLRVNAKAGCGESREIMSATTGASANLRLSGSNLSRALNLHLSGSDLQGLS